jgi:allophanate hydrolase subunit 1
MAGHPDADPEPKDLPFAAVRAGGFAPGFAYLTGLDPARWLPRRPVIAVVAERDVDRSAQLRPGDGVRFRATRTP